MCRDGSEHETVGQKGIAGYSRQSRNQGIESQGRLMCRDTGYAHSHWGGGQTGKDGTGIERKDGRQ